jgi:hypothetical protein
MDQGDGDGAFSDSGAFVVYSKDDRFGHLSLSILDVP